MLYVSAGHNPGAEGATGNGVTEHSLAVKWVNTLHRHLKGRVEYTIVPVGTLSSKIRFINKTARPNDLAVEIHFNAAPGRVGVGSETLYHPDSIRGRHAAEALQRGLELNGLALPNRGAKEGWYHGAEGKHTALAFLEDTRCVSLVLEPAFVYDDATLAQEDAICSALAALLIELSEGIKNG